MSSPWPSTAFAHQSKDHITIFCMPKQKYYILAKFCCFSHITFTKGHFWVHKFVEVVHSFSKTWLLQYIVNAGVNRGQKQCKEIFFVLLGKNDFFQRCPTQKMCF